MALYSITYVTLALVLGITAHYYGISFAHAALLMLLGCAAGLLLAHRKYNKLSSTLIFMSLAFIIGHQRLASSMQKHEAFLDLLSTHECTLRGTLSSWQKTGNVRLPYRLTIDVENITTEDTPRLHFSENHSVYVFTQKKPTCLIADSICLRHITCKKPSNAEYQQYLTKEGIAATIFTQKFSFHFIKRPTYSFHRWLFYTREDLMNRLSQKLSPQTFHLCASVFYGYPASKKEIDPLKHYFKIWGVVHYLARSGLHLVIFIIVWQFMLRYLPLGFRFKEFCMLLLCTIYYLLSWPSIPFDRSYASFLLSKASSLFLVRTYYLASFSVVTFIMLAYNPMYLFFLDFQLSFGITCALALFSHLHTKRSRIS